MATRPRKQRQKAAVIPPKPNKPKRSPLAGTRSLKMTDRQRRFVTEYLVDLNATKAAIRAGYSVNSAARLGSDLLKKPLVAAAIAERQAKRFAKIDLSAERVLNELARIAFSDLREVARWGPTADEPLRGVQLRASEEIHPDAAAAVESVMMTEHGARISLHSKTKALELLAKHHGLLVDRVKVENPEDVARQFAEALRAMETSGAFPAPPAQVTP